MTTARPPAAIDRIAPSLLVDTGRLWQRLGLLAEIGATPGGGVDRPALSPLEASARRRVKAWAEEIGLVPFADTAGNLFLRLAGASDGADPVLAGSYLDTQPGGGRYSGAYGMLAALEALAAIAASGFRPHRPIIAAAWMNGEGSRFRPGYTGSEAFAGLISPAAARDVRDARGVTSGSAIDAWLASDPGLARAPLGFAIRAYVETHLEQGPILEESRKQIGIVTGMQGVRRFTIEVTGEAAHAGAMPRRKRRDALSAAIRIISSLDDFFAAPDVSFTVGQLSVTPNAPSVVPRATSFSVDVRHGDDTVLTRLGDGIRLICETEKGPCQFCVTESASMASIAFDEGVQATIGFAAQRSGLTAMPIVSLGGHDAKSLSRKAPSGIVFIPCKGGISHSEAEEITQADAANGARVLADTLWALAHS